MIMANSPELIKFAKSLAGKARQPPVVFSNDAVEKAKTMLQQLATLNPDAKIRLEASKFIMTANVTAAAQQYQGVDLALADIAGLPEESQRAALLVAYDRRLLTRDDLDVALKVIASSEAAKIAALEAHNASLVKRVETQDLALRDASMRSVPQGTQQYKDTQIIEAEISLPPHPVPQGQASDAPLAQAAE